MQQPLHYTRTLTLPSTVMAYKHTWPGARTTGIVEFITFTAILQGEYPPYPPPFPPVSSAVTYVLFTRAVNTAMALRALGKCRCGFENLEVAIHVHVRTHRDVRDTSFARARGLKATTYTMGNDTGTPCAHHRVHVMLIPSQMFAFLITGLLVQMTVF